MVLFNTVLFSCTPETITDNENETQLVQDHNIKECCGDGEDTQNQ